MWVVYKHTLLADCKHKGWSYIGITHYTDNLNARFHGGSNYSYNKLFYADIKNYGWKNFEHKIIQSDIQTQAEAYKAERYWIAYYHTWIKDKEYIGGYNQSPGGPGANHRLTIIKGNDFSTVKVILSHKFEDYEKQGWRTLTIAEYKYWWLVVLGKQKLENIKSRERYKVTGKAKYQKNKTNRLLSSKKYTDKKKAENLELFRQKHREANRKYLLQHKDEINKKRREKRKQKNYLQVKENMIQ